MSIEQYLEMEKASPVRHEYIRGCVFAITDATDAHNKIGGRIFSLLNLRLKTTGWTVYKSEMKVRIEEPNVFYYPDLMVTNEQYVPTSLFKTSPTLIVEILSPATANIDRREKLANYGSIPSLREYLMFHQHKPLAELYRKNEKTWNSSETFKAEDTVIIESLPGESFQLQLEELYHGVWPTIVLPEALI
ncbi:MAG: Uma2 family endonuclease [Terriglobales bacterium]